MDPPQHLVRLHRDIPSHKDSTTATIRFSTQRSGCVPRKMIIATSRLMSSFGVPATNTGPLPHADPAHAALPTMQAKMPTATTITTFRASCILPQLAISFIQVRIHRKRRYRAIQAKMAWERLPSQPSATESVLQCFTIVWSDGPAVQRVAPALGRVAATAADQSECGPRCRFSGLNPSCSPPRRVAKLIQRSSSSFFLIHP